MKKLLPLLSIAALLTACSGEPKTETRTLQSANTAATPIDTAGLAQFQQWKTQNELAATQPVAPQPQPAVEQPAPVKQVTVVREVVVERERPARRQAPRVVQTPPANPTPPATTDPTPNTTAGTGDNQSTTGSGTTADPAPAPQTAKKEGWSKSTKGAVIGSAGGAVIGAVINKKNPAVGAVIGGVLGGAVGYGIGKNKDKKDTTNR